MRHLTVTSGWSIGFAMSLCWTLVASVCGGKETIDFTNDLMPLFTKYGCNTGACHGAAIGRGGFKLSLYGGNPESDYLAIVRQMSSRRINFTHPERSLVVLKPTEHVEHGGGNVFDYDSDGARLLVTWIRQGAKYDSKRHLARVAITPQKYIANSLGESVALSAVVHYVDGTSRDVTRWTIFSAEDESAIEISEVDTAAGLRRSAANQAHGAESVPATQARLLRRGRHVVVARYLSEVVPIELIVPLTDSRIDLFREPQNNFIDQEVLRSLAALGLRPSPVIDDATFFRRLSLDLTGRLPTVKRIKRFLDDKNQDKRNALIDELLDSEEFNEYWTLQLAKLLKIRPQRDDEKAAFVYHGWLADQIRDDVSYKVMAHTLLTSSGDSHEVGPANFYRTSADPRKLAEFMSEVFMGSRLRCANCHNHPLDHWTQDDYHGLAAIFAKMEHGRFVSEKPSGQTIHPRTREPAIQRIPGGPFLDGEASDGREQLAEWLTDRSNPYFAKAIVNRLWKRMMGRGLVEPADDFRATNPPTHPILLDQLSADFANNGYSLRHIIRMIASSATYARSADATEQNKDDDRFYSHAQRRLLEPEVLADAISDVLGVASTYGDEPLGTRAVTLIDPRTPSQALDVLGRCDREESCESSAVTMSGLPEKLHLFNGELINARIDVQGSRLQQLLSDGKSPLKIVNSLYLAALSRRPSPQEKQHWQQQLASLTSAADRRAFLVDFVWGLTTCNEFVTNH